MCDYCCDGLISGDPNFNSLENIYDSLYSYSMEKMDPIIIGMIGFRCAPEEIHGNQNDARHKYKDWYHKKAQSLISKFFSEKSEDEIRELASILMIIDESEDFRKKFEQTTDTNVKFVWNSDYDSLQKYHLKNFGAYSNPEKEPIFFYLGKITHDSIDDDFYTKMHDFLCVHGLNQNFYSENFINLCKDLFDEIRQESANVKDCLDNNKNDNVRSKMIKN